MNKAILASGKSTGEERIAETYKRKVYEAQHS